MCSQSAPFDIMRRHSALRLERSLCSGQHSRYLLFEVKGYVKSGDAQLGPKGI